MKPRRLLPLAAGLLTTAALLEGADPQPTPTPEPQLSGGFGKAAPPAPARRRAEKKAVRITNESLVTDPQKGKLTTSQAVVTPPGGAARTAAARTPGGGPTPTPGAAPTPAAGAQGEEYWRNEARRVRERVTELRAAIIRLENETRKMEADFYSWDDGAYRDGVIKPAWDKAREDLATARRELPAGGESARRPSRSGEAGGRSARMVARVSELPSYRVETWGCQMNVLDGERMAGQLEGRGYRAAGEGQAADVVILNTCAVREKAEAKVYSALGVLGRRKQENPDLVIGVTGCVAQVEGAGDPGAGAVGRLRARHRQRREDR